MNKIFLFLVMTLIIVNYTNAQEYTDYHNYASRNIKTSGQVDADGFGVGEWKHYSEKGDLEYIVNHTTKISKKYYVTGELKEQGTFNPDTGAHIGEWITYYRNGKIKVIGINDEDGEKNGEFKSYFKSGTLKSVIRYKNGIKQG